MSTQSIESHSAASSSASSSPEPAPRRCLFPGPWTILITLLAAAGICAVRLTEMPPDRAGQNLLSGGLIGLTLITWFCWFVMFSGHAAAARRVVGLGGLVLVVAAIASVRFDQFTGNMIPTFRWAWVERSDERLGKPELVEADVKLATTTPIDFPQYLGPRRDGTVDAVQLNDNWSTPPKIIWKRPIGAGWSGFAAVNGHAVTLEQRGPDELVTCYDVQSGQPAWAHSIATRHETVLGGVGPRSTPTIHEGRVYALGATGILRCLDGVTGELIWSQNIPQLVGMADGNESNVVAWGRSSSPLIVDDLVVVPGGGPTGKTVSLVAFHLQDGSEAWRGGTSQISYSSPIVANLQGRRQIVVVNESSVSGHDPADGKVLWTFPWKGSSTADANTSQPHVFEDTVVVSKGYPGGGLARFKIEGDSGQEMYHQDNVLKTKLTSIILQPGTVFAFGLSDGILQCADLTDGRSQWKGGRYGHGQVLLVGQLLLVLSEKGELALVRATPEKYDEIARLPVLDGKTWNTLCLYGRFLLVRNSEEAAAVELPTVGS